MKPLQVFIICTLGFFFAMIAIELFWTMSPLPTIDRLTRFEDICSYGSCVVVPPLAGGVVTLVFGAIALLNSK